MEREHFSLMAIALSVLLAAWMLWPFADAIIWAGVTAYLLHHAADAIDDYIDNRAVTTALMLLTLIGIVAGLTYLFLTSIPQLARMLGRFSQALSGSVTLFIDIFDLPPELASTTRTVINQFTAQGRSYLLDRVSSLPGIVLHLVIYFVVAAFLVRDGRRFTQQAFETISGLPTYYRRFAVSLIESVDQLFRGVFLSYFVVAVAVWILGTVGFYLMGLDFYWGWGLLAGVLAFFPVVSETLVYVPLTLLYIATGDLWLGATIFVYGLVVMNLLPEIFLRPYVAASQTHEHLLLLFLGFIIGPLVLGLKGVILGPLILIIAKNMLTMRYVDGERFDAD